MMMGERKIYFHLPSHTQPEVRDSIVLVILVTVLVTNSMR